MSLPAANYITDLDPAQPVGSQVISEGDDWLRLLQLVVKQSFPAISGPVTPSHTKLNFLADVTSLIQAQIDGKASTAQLATVTSTGALPLVIETATAVAAAEGTHHALSNVALTTVTLPASPTVGATIRVTPINALATNIIARNGKPIMSLAEDMTLNATNFSVTLRYINATVGWRLV